MTRHVWHILSCCHDSKVVWERYISLSVLKNKCWMFDERPQTDVKGYSVRHAVPTPAISAGPPPAACWARHKQFKQTTGRAWGGGCFWYLLCCATLPLCQRLHSGGRVTARRLIRPTADRYSCTVGVSVSVKTRKPIYRIHRYCTATSEYSPIWNIGLTLFVMRKLKWLT